MAEFQKCLITFTYLTISQMKFPPEFYPTKSLASSTNIEQILMSVGTSGLGVQLSVFNPSIITPACQLRHNSILDH